VRSYLSVLVVSSVVFGGSAFAAEKKPAAKAKSAEAVKGPHLVVEPAEHDFGKAVQNKTLTKEFVLKNTGTEELVISEVATSCGCTVAQLSTKTLKPGASTPLTVNLETRTYNGKLERWVTIASNDAETKQLQLKVSAEVTPAPAAPAQ